MCSQLLAWGMLREDQGGHQASNGDVVAYYEALPNEAQATEPVTFDADGSYQYTAAGSRERVPAESLSYAWDFGDGGTGSGRTVDHAYAKAGVYTSTLTVTNGATGQSDTMTIPITVEGTELAGPVLGDAPAEDADGTFDLAWQFDEAARQGFSHYRVEEARDMRTALDDPAEDLTAGWQASTPTEPTIQPWQHSDQADGSVRGNVRHGGERSFYTGVDRADQRPGVGPNSGVSLLTLKAPVTLAGDAELTYWSSYANDNNDVSRVEAAVDDGSGTLSWKTVDEVTTSNFFNIPTDELLYPTGMQQRRVDLGGFAGKPVRLRFVYALGSSQFINVYRTGWYVDDIRIDAGTFATIGETTAKTFTVAKRRLGAYAYRVKGLYADGTATRASNVETVTVTGRGGKKPRP